MQKISKTTAVAIAGLLIAIATLLSFTSLPINNFLQIRLTSIPFAVAGFILGPAYASIIGAIADVLGHFARPTGPFFPGFTLSNIATGIIFGLMLYKKKTAVWRVLIAAIINAVIVGLLLNTLWLSILYGKGFLPLISARIVKELVMVPINTAMYMVVLTAISKIKIFSHFNSANSGKEK